MKSSLYSQIPERTFTAHVIQLARYLGYMTAHFRPGRTRHGWATAVQGDGKGFPDLVLARLDRLIFAELKSEKGKLTKKQEFWLTILRQTGVEAYIWRPADFDEIKEILQGGGPIGGLK